DSPLAFGFRDKEGPAQWAWGEEIPAEGSPVTLRFQDFHFPHCRKNQSWDAFPNQGCWSLSDFQERDFPAQILPALSLGLPEEFPLQDAWRGFCAKIEKRLEAGSLQKAVPARSCVYSLTAPVAARLR